MSSTQTSSDASNRNRKSNRNTSSGCPYASQFITTPELTPTYGTDDERSLEQDKLLLTQNIARCPAFAKNQNRKNHTTSTTNKSSSKENDPTTTVSCPFRNATSQKDVQRIMLQVPPSHVSDFIGSSSNTTSNTTTTTAAQFKRALEVMHSVSKSNAVESNEQYKMVVADCPFKGALSRRRRSADNTATTSTTKGNNNPNNNNTLLSFVNVFETLSLTSIMSQMAEDVDDSFDDKQTSAAGVSAKLKQGTAKSHREAENVLFVRNFIKGKIDRALYVDMIVSLWFVYCALEEELDKYAVKANFASLHQPLKLNRREALERDLKFFLGSEWRSQVKASVATDEYVQRIHSVAAADPILLVAHSYTRYLGDLSGGKVLQRVAKKALGLEKAVDGGVDGLRFYEFDAINEGAKAFKNHYRETLDGMDLSPWQVKRLVGEANVAFVLNMRLFEELDVADGVNGASVRPLEDALMYLIDLGEVESSKEDEKCPFGFTGKNPHAKEKEVPEQRPKVSASSEDQVSKGGRCPWPFVVFHDPATFARDWQTWVVIGILVSWGYKKVVVDQS